MFCGSHQGVATQVAGARGIYDSSIITYTEPDASSCSVCSMAAQMKAQGLRIEPRAAPRLPKFEPPPPVESAAPGETLTPVREAARRHAEEASAQRDRWATSSRATAAARAESRSEQVAFVREFLELMNAAGNPGAEPIGHRRSTYVGWVFAIKVEDSYDRRYGLTVDGLVVPVVGWSKPLIGRPQPFRTWALADFDQPIPKKRLTGLLLEHGALLSE